MTAPTPLPEAQVRHRTAEIDGIGVFYREAGPPEAPVVGTRRAPTGRYAGHIVRGVMTVAPRLRRMKPF